jgi:hypothetical protein
MERGTLSALRFASSGGARLPDTPTHMTLTFHDHELCDSLKKALLPFGDGVPAISVVAGTRDDGLRHQRQGSR